MDGWIKLHRKLLEWRWVNHLPTLRVWLEILLRAEWQGPGAGVAKPSLSELTHATGMSKREVRRALENLEKTGEIKRFWEGTQGGTKRGTRRGTLIVNYSRFQFVDKKKDRRTGAVTSAAEGAQKRTPNRAQNRTPIPYMNKKEEREEEKKTTTSSSKESDYLARARRMAEARGRAAGGARDDVDDAANVCFLDFKKGLRED